MKKTVLLMSICAALHGCTSPSESSLIHAPGDSSILIEKDYLAQDTTPVIRPVLPIDSAFAKNYPDLEYDSTSGSYYYTPRGTDLIFAHKYPYDIWLLFEKKAYYGSVSLVFHDPDTSYHPNREYCAANLVPKNEIVDDSN